MEKKLNDFYFIDDTPVKYTPCEDCEFNLNKNSCIKYKEKPSQIKNFEIPCDFFAEK